MKSNNFKKKLFRIIFVIILLTGALLGYEWIITLGRTQIQVNILQNKELIYYSTFAEPPQFAVWLENSKTHQYQTVFVTHRSGIGDWEGKSDVPVALPRWSELFKGKGTVSVQPAGNGDESVSAITGATPKGDYFSVRAEVKPGSEWICWVEMNLAGDFNDAYPEIDLENKKEDEFSNGQPALIYRSEITATEGAKYEFELVSQSIWEAGETTVEPVSEGVTTAKEVFSKMDIEVIRPKPKLINLHKNNIIQETEKP